MPDFTADVRAALVPLRLDPQREATLAEELRQHMDDRYDDLRGSGHDEASARAGALAELAGLAAQHRTLRSALGPAATPAPMGGRPRSNPLEWLLYDARYALRSLRSHPVYAAVALLTFAVGIGGCALI